MAVPTSKEIDVALREGQLVLHFQPILAIPLNRIAGFEALLRWRPSEGSLRSPVELIRAAEQTGQIVEVGRWVLHAACAALSRIHGAVGEDSQITMSVNVAARQWQEPSLFRDVDSALADSQLNPRRLKLELTESTLVGSPEATRKAIVRFKNNGVGCCIDDFGTGYASLNYLNEFPADTLKIDRSFVRKIGVTRDALKIPRAIVDLAHNLRMEVIAEGVETPEQLREAGRLNCEYVQGFFFAMPLSEDDAIDFAVGNLDSTMPAAQVSLDPESSTVRMTALGRTGSQSLRYGASACVHGISGPLVGKTVRLTEPVVVFGRDAHADVVVEDPHLSRKHACVAREADGRYVLEDCRSTNGTFCNGQRVQCCPLEDGDRIRIGTCVFEFRVSSGSDEESRR